MFDAELRERRPDHLVIPMIGLVEKGLVRRASHRGDVAHGEGEYGGRALRYVGDAARELLTAHGPDTRAVDADLSGAGDKDPREALDQRRFAGAVRPQQTQHLARLERKGYFLKDPPSAVGEGEIFNGEPHPRHPARRRMSSIAKNGAPMSEVSIPSGISFIVRARAALSIRIR